MNPDSTQPSTTPLPAILLIDDDLALCAMMSEYLREQGYRVDTAADGRDGLAQALAGSHDLITLDVMLPVLDGIEVLRTAQTTHDRAGDHVDGEGLGTGPNPGSRCRRRRLPGQAVSCR